MEHFLGQIGLMGLAGVLTLVGLFFWIRGMCRGSKADLAAGGVIFLLACGGILTWQPVAAVAGVGGLMMICGVTTAIVVATNPKDMTPAVRQDFRVLATGLIIIGFFLGMVL